MSNHTETPIYPQNSNAIDRDKRGITLRDHFAIEALPIAWDAVKNRPASATCTDLANMSYLMADAMLKARGGDL